MTGALADKATAEAALESHDTLKLEEDGTMGLVSLRLVRAAGFQVEKKRWISKIIQAPGLDVRISNIIVFAPALDECGYIRGNVFLLQLFFFTTAVL